MSDSSDNTLNSEHPAFGSKPTENQPVRTPDKVHKGCINYEIQWFGNQALVIIPDITYEDRVAITWQSLEDMTVFIQQLKTNPNAIKEKFTVVEKAAIFKARYMMEKFLIRFLNAVYLRMFKGEMLNKIKDENPPQKGDLTESLPVTE